MGLHSDYIFANIPRYLSSHDLRLTYRGTLETKEYLISKLLTNHNLKINHLPYLGLFLGGDHLIDEKLFIFLHEKLAIDIKFDFDVKIRMLIELLDNNKITIDNFDEFIQKFNLTEYKQVLKDCIQKYQNKLKGKRNNLNSTQNNNNKKNVKPSTTSTSTQNHNKPTDETMKLLNGANSGQGDGGTYLS